jgi:hypothetical protein
MVPVRGRAHIGQVTQGVYSPTHTDPLGLGWSFLQTEPDVFILQDMEEGGLVPGFPSDTEIFKYSNLLCKKNNNNTCL